MVIAVAQPVIAAVTSSSEPVPTPRSEPSAAALTISV